MLSYRKFTLSEEEMSKREAERRLRKNIDGSKPPVQDASMPVVHHNSQEGITAYKMTGAESCGKAGSPKWCTTPKESMFRDRYLERGNMYVLHAHNQAIQAYMPHKKINPNSRAARGYGMKPELRNQDNLSINHMELRKQYPSVVNIPGWREHFGSGKYDKSDHTKENMVGIIKKIPQMHERLRHLKGIIDHSHDSSEISRIDTDKTTSSRFKAGQMTGRFAQDAGPRLKSKDYNSVALHLGPEDLHHFADDHAPEIRHHVATHAPPHTIPHELTQDPHPDVRRTAQQRTMGMALKPAEKPPEAPGKGQKAFSFMKQATAAIKKKQAQKAPEGQGTLT